MKTNTIRIVGKRLFENHNQLDIGHVEIVVNVSDLLDEIDNEDIIDYAEDTLNMRHEEDFESNIDDFTESELVEALEDMNHNFSYRIGEYDCIEFLEDGGYTVTADEDVVGNGLDYIDAQRLEDVQKKFIDSSWDDKLIMYNKIFNL